MEKNAVYTQQEREQEIAQIGEEILKNARNELYLSMRFLDVALSQLRLTPDWDIRGLGTDGACLFFKPDSLAQLYRRGRRTVNRAYLHMVIHCLFGHMYRRKERDVRYWNLACDIAAEYVMDGLYQSCVHAPGSHLRRECCRQMKKELKVVTAQAVYRWLCSQSMPPARLEQIEREFLVDDHSRWQSEAPKNQQQTPNRWEDIREKMQTEMETFGREAADDSRSLLEQVQVENRQRYDYRKFLRKFAVLKEEMQVDMDTFDYIFYNYGMELYGNMPLIEPQETREVPRVEDFVIVIDTSMSCKGELVQRFLEETYSVLSESESFFRKLNIHIIQCDDQIQSDTKITGREQLKEYMGSFTVRGQGGTDFRPAFAYVEELLANGAFGRLRGLIYFTDGYGIFPGKKPFYETAFVFIRGEYREVDVPPWAIKLILDPSEEDPFSSGER